MKLYKYCDLAKECPSTKEQPLPVFDSISHIESKFTLNLGT